MEKSSSRNYIQEDRPILFIPARMGSKGLPFKNRQLLKYTLDSIPDGFHDRIIVSTDDPQITEMCHKRGIVVDIRNTNLSNDTASIKDVLVNFARSRFLRNEQRVVMLYLTYPERRWFDIVEAYNFFRINNAKSMLCRKEANSHPHLMMYTDGQKGKQVIEHDLYRRQDYPDVFEVSHFIAILQINELLDLNSNIYNKETIFFPIKDKIDIDTFKDLQKFNPTSGRKHVLILGNDKTLNYLKYAEFNDGVIIVGINRAHEIVKTDYTFFGDNPIFDEIYEKEDGNMEQILKYNLVTSDWIYKDDTEHEMKQWVDDGVIRMHTRERKNSFPDSVTIGLEYFNRLFEGNVTFYVYGVSLRYDEKENHFWTKHKGKKEPGKDWSEPRFNRILRNFRKLKAEGTYDIVSVSKDSRINDIFEYQDVKMLMDDGD